MRCNSSLPLFAAWCLVIQRKNYNSPQVQNAMRPYSKLEEAPVVPVSKYGNEIITCGYREERQK
jgi:hypothetical protein